MALWCILQATVYFSLLAWLLRLFSSHFFSLFLFLWAQVNLNLPQQFLLKWICGRAQTYLCPWKNINCSLFYYTVTIKTNTHSENPLSDDHYRLRAFKVIMTTVNHQSHKTKSLLPLKVWSWHIWSTYLYQLHGILGIFQVFTLLLSC